MQPAANGWNLQRRRTRLSLSAWSRIVPPTHLSCNNLDRRSNQTNEATPCQSKTIQCCQQQTIGTKQSRNSKHFTRLCPLHPFLKPPFWQFYLRFCQFCLRLPEFAIFSFLHFVWNLNRHQVKRSKRDGLLRLGKIWRKVAKNHPDTLSVNTSCVSWVAVFVDCRLWDTKFTPLLEFQPHYFPLSHSRSCLHANRLVLISCSLSLVKTKITLKKLTGEYLFGYTTQGWVTFENITANWISMTSFTHLWPNCKTLSHKSTSLRCQILFSLKMEKMAVHSLWDDIVIIEVLMEMVAGPLLAIEIMSEMEYREQTIRQSDRGTDHHGSSVRRPRLDIYCNLEGALQRLTQ